MSPDAVIEAVKDAGLRGRGGAGFPTGLKWSFIPQSTEDKPGDGKPHYLVVNADESEPGTCKDMPLMMATPHTLVEGVIIAAYAIRAAKAFIYVRGEVVPVLRRLQTAVAEAYAAGYLAAASSVRDSTWISSCTPEQARTSVVRRQPPRFVGGTTRSASTAAAIPRRRRPLRLPDRRQQRRVHRECAVDRPGRPGVVPVDGKREVAGVHVVLALWSCHHSRPVRGAARHHVARTSRLRGRRSHRAHPQVLDSRRILDSDLHRRTSRCPTRLRGVGAAGSMLGTKALQIFDDTTCIVRAVLRWTEFYAHESCGKCTPCREGTYWLVQILRRLEGGTGTEADLTKLLDISDTILGKSFCALGDGATSPIMSSLKYFREEYVAHFDGNGCPFDPRRSVLATGAFVS